MSVIGIVAEYNPFHRGHEYHIHRTRKLVGADATVVCVMSGDFVQRGEAAIYNKFARAEAACRCGADLVIELPLPWSLASAEGFARGAVYLLNSLGCDTLSFGSESGDINALDVLVDVLLLPDINEQIKHILQENPNMSYAAARQQVTAIYCGEAARLLETPNNILALEYLKAIRTLGFKLRPMTVQRFGSPHDGTGGGFKSAAELRELLQAGRSISDELPAEAAEVFAREDRLGRGMSRSDLLETAILSRLRVLKAEEFDHLPDASNGLGRRLFLAAAEEPSLEALMTAVKSKRFAMSRVRRMICCAALGVTDDLTNGRPPYARLLAANARGCEHLKNLRGGACPIVTKPAAVRQLSAYALQVFELGAQAHDLAALASPAVDARRGGADWRTSPIIL